jgi:septal ring factor EnvC (AmiA/AmiB activator)
MMIDNLFIAAATIVAAALSVWVSRRAQHVQAKTHAVDHELNRARRVDQATSTLLDGYKDMVDDLRDEVTRLNGVIDDLRREQEECERRNDEMESLIWDLQRRLVNLEGKSHE